MAYPNEALKVKPKKAAGAAWRAFGLYFTLLLWALTTILPLLWVFENAFKSSAEILHNAVALPSALNFDNFRTLVAYPDVNMARAFINSLCISGSVVLGVAFIAGMAAFVLGRMESRLCKFVDALLVACLLVPSFATIIPNFVTVSKIPFFKGTYLTAIVPQIAGNLCFSILLLSAFMRSLPKELDEAAIIDGAGIPKIFLRITLPLSMPMFATVGIMAFIWSYNDLLTAMVFISKQTMKPVCVILSMVSNMYGTDYGALMAAIFITVLPLLALYVLSQEQVIKGLTVGAVKG